MKKGIYKDAVVILATGLVFGIASTGSASAFTINSGATEVGGLDTLLRIGFLANNGDQSEVNWVNGILGSTFTKVEMTKYTSQTWYDVDGSDGDMQALDLVTDGGYFFIKTGNIVIEGLTGGVKQNEINMPDHFLYRNVSLSDWAVIAFSQITSSLELFLDGLGQQDATVKSFNVETFSHIGEFGEATPPTEIPEPATMLLFGTGLIGLAGARRRTRRK